MTEDTDSNERDVKRHYFDSQTATDQERIIDAGIDLEFESMDYDERMNAGRDYRDSVKGKYRTAAEGFRYHIRGNGNGVIIEERTA